MPTRRELWESWEITEIDFDKKRVSLSIRALLEPAVEAVEEAAE